MLKRKAFNRIFVTTIIFFVVLILYGVHKTSTNNITVNPNKTNSYIYTINDDNYVSKVSIYVNKSLKIEDQIRDKLETMIKDNNKNMLLPSYFKPILPENTKIEEVKLEDSIIKIYFSKELINISKEQSEKMIESIIYTITDENILGVEIYVDGSMLKYVPNTTKKLPTLLTRDFGINKTYKVSRFDDITKIVMNYSIKDGNSFYDVPVTKYVNDNREKIEIIIDELNKTNAKNLLSFVDNVNILSYEFKDKVLTIVVDKDIDDQCSENLIKSIFSNYDLNKIEIYYNNQKKVEKTKKDIES